MCYRCLGVACCQKLAQSTVSFHGDSRCIGFGPCQDIAWSHDQCCFHEVLSLVTSLQCLYAIELTTPYFVTFKNQPLYFLSNSNPQNQQLLIASNHCLFVLIQTVLASDYSAPHS
uniref:Uncharacterized protein n=1 Tax=Timspurckia oligopyrenoides TaxID=708627 RepID=A0A7S1EUM6_9RHOD